MRPPEALGRKTRSSLSSRVSPVSRSWLSFRCATSGSPSTMLLVGSCGRQCRAARKDARRLPGFPASHGCIRMPDGFAARLFDLTRLGMRVIVAPTDVAPIEITHPALFMPKPGADTLAAARTVEAEEAARKAAQARQAAVTASRESGRAMIDRQ